MRYQVGTMVKGRPWHRSRQLAAHKGLIVGDWGEDGYVVWFYGSGEPDIGTSVQGMNPRELTEVGTDGDRWTLGTDYLKRLERQAVRFGRTHNGWDRLAAALHHTWASKDGER